MASGSQIIGWVSGALNWLWWRLVKCTILGAGSLISSNWIFRAAVSTVVFCFYGVGGARLRCHAFRYIKGRRVFLVPGKRSDHFPDVGNMIGNLK